MSGALHLVFLIPYRSISSASPPLRAGPSNRASQQQEETGEETVKVQQQRMMSLLPRK